MSEGALAIGGEPGLDWRELERRMRPYVAARVAPADVDDVLQDLWCRLHRGLRQLRDSERFDGWVRGVARSAIADHLRARRRHPLPDAPPDEDRPLAAGAEDDGDDDAARAPAVQLLTSSLVVFIAALPEPYRQALTLTELEGMTQARAAEVLGISLPAMKSRVLRGRERLRAMLHACCEIALDARHRVVACAPRALGELPPDCCR